jgi:hypothetical protein
MPRWKGSLRCAAPLPPRQGASTFAQRRLLLRLPDCREAPCFFRGSARKAVPPPTDPLNICALRHCRFNCDNESRLLGVALYDGVGVFMQTHARCISNPKSRPLSKTKSPSHRGAMFDSQNFPRHPLAWLHYMAFDHEVRNSILWMLELTS